MTKSKCVCGVRCWTAMVVLLALLFGPTRIAPGISNPVVLAQDDDEDVPRRRVGVQWDEGVPQMSVSVRDLANEGVRRKLESGLPQTMTFRVLTYQGRSSEPVAMVERSCRVAFDLWEEVFRVELREGSRERTVTLNTVNAVIDRCLVARRWRVASAEAAGPHRQVYFAVLVELNPMSEETVQRIRRWLARPSEGEGEAFFGSFVSLFVNRELGDAERRIQFRSQWIEVP